MDEKLPKKVVQNDTADYRCAPQLKQISKGKFQGATRTDHHTKAYRETGGQHQDYFPDTCWKKEKQTTNNTTQIKPRIK